MTRKILINALDPDESRIASLKDNKLEQFHIETTSKQATQGNIYKGIVTRVEPSLQAVFVDYGAPKNGFLQKNEIHKDYFQDVSGHEKALFHLIKKGQELIVQVTKDPINQKGAMLTTFISLPGRLSVLMPGNSTKGVSRKIDDEAERKRLISIMKKIKVPEGFGMIVRTAGKNATKTLLDADLKELMRVWKSIDKKAINDTAPALLYQEQTLAVRSLRDYFTSDVNEILIDNPEVYEEVKDFIGLIAPKQKKIVKFFKGEKPIFTKYQLEDQIASIYKKSVPLPSGGFLVIEQTEALVSIDVNSGKSTKKKNIEETAFHTNLEACEEVARQLSLRDMGGLIVIDFIDMRESRHKAEITKSMKKFLKSDKAKTKVGGITPFGLLEMSRQRIRHSITFGSYEPCRHCSGRGQIPSVETQGLAFLRQLNLKTIKTEVKEAIGIVPNEVASYLLNKKREELSLIESKRDVIITIEGDPHMVSGENKIVLNHHSEKDPA
ncbi:MAG: Rne/Rng family ribonuclease [Proteobacteria bacterium]|nr:Rne/Rng family ribonuclease [Pseudomonadota bacterium]MBU1389856.1 Rne/Rng family ribonuclease [Pseudomonadota bacterium]MBU1543865.1 Rne/Rng family ribonuclease [Pseudomonadota bacterium]MBU2481098.1 Rne/Rng family ribonuclease [Pseudomonadota bacterium]